MKYVFFDIDGTIRGKSREITKRNREAICKLRENGHKAFLCTGRAPVSITQDILDVGFDGVISAAGSFIQIDGKYIYENFLDSKRLQQAIVLFSNAQVGFTLETKDELFQSGYAREYMERRQIKDTQANPELARFFEKRNQAFKPITEYNPGKDKVTKIVFIAYDKYALLDTVPHLSKDFNVVLFSKPEDEFINGEIISKNCTKADAIERVIDYYHASMEDTIAFGDSMNDYQMIEKVNKGIVFEGAKEKLLDISYDTFIDPDQDGIALSLEKLLARILEYFNGTLFLDDNYRFCVFFIENYIDFYKMTLEEVVEKSKISQEAILNFLKHLGFDDYASFQDQLYADVILRQDQIRSRMLGLKMDDLFKQIHLCDDQDKFICDLDHICHDISTSKRVVIIGALYPISIAVEFQTDLITFGKPVFQYHSFDNQLILNKDDYVIFVSATGRAYDAFMEQHQGFDINRSQFLLITQNKKYKSQIGEERVIYVASSRYDSIDFNYRLMSIFDIMRVTYYKKYHFI